LAELTLFAQMPTGPEAIIAQVRRDLARDSTTLPAADLDALAEDAVHRLWDSRVKVFIPVLALREVRESLAQQGGQGSLPPSALPISDAAGSSSLATSSSLPDTLSMAEDRLPHDPQDVVPLP
jgi:hypothetical protein